MDKKITDLQLISAVTDILNIPGDDTTQTYRFTAAQLALYIRMFGELAVITISGVGTTLTNNNQTVLLDPTSASFTQALPACASLRTGLILKFKNIATNGNVVTLDANSTELIDNALTLDLGSSPTLDSATLYNLGTKWLII